MQQSSFSDIAQHFASAARQGANLAATRNANQLGNTANSAGNNVAMARKLQFYTSNNFYPSKQQAKKPKYDHTENTNLVRSDSSNNHYRGKKEHDKIVTSDEDTVKNNKYSYRNIS